MLEKRIFTLPKSDWLTRNFHKSWSWNISDSSLLFVKQYFCWKTKPCPWFQLIMYQKMFIIILYLLTNLLLDWLIRGCVHCWLIFLHFCAGFLSFVGEVLNFSFSTDYQKIFLLFFSIIIILFNEISLLKMFKCQLLKILTTL